MLTIHRPPTIPPRAPLSIHGVLAIAALCATGCVLAVPRFESHASPLAAWAQPVAPQPVRARQPSAQARAMASARSAFTDVSGMIAGVSRPIAVAGPAGR